MLFSELMRVIVLLVAGLGTALGAVSAILAEREDSAVLIVVGAVWWLVATALGLWLGDQRRVGEAMARPLAAARTAASLPVESATRIALERLWPIGAFALVAGVAGFVWPQVAVIGAGYAILIALAWRRREAAIQAIEDRDGVRFYVEPSSAFAPLRLVRTPGLYRDRAPGAKPPPPLFVPS